MNFNNPFLNPYGYAQPYPQQQAQQQAMQSQMPEGRQAPRVNGRNGAMQYPMGPNCSDWVLDVSGELSWLIMTDSAGYRTVTPYDVSPHQEEQKKDYSDLETRVKRLEDMMNGGKRNGNTGNSSAAGKKTDGSEYGKD